MYFYLAHIRPINKVFLDDVGIMKKDHHYSDIIIVTPREIKVLGHLGEIILFIFDIITWAVLPILFRAYSFRLNSIVISSIMI